MTHEGDLKNTRHGGAVARLFPCDTLFVKFVERGVRESLASSLEHVYEAAAVAPICDARDFRHAIQEIGAHRLSPALFGRYYETILAIEAGDDRTASHLFRELLVLAEQDLPLKLLPFDRTSLGVEFERYGRTMNGGGDAQPRFASPERAQWLRFEHNVTAARALLEQTDVDLASELRTLVVEIIGAASPPESARRAFGGASSFMLWGAVFLNVDRHQTVLDALEGLVHEAAHLLLFGLSHQEPLTTNPIEERYHSPLRADPRPMDGVFHATFVCARLAYLYRRLKLAGPSTLSDADLRLVEDRIDAQKRLFREGYDVIEKYGQLTATGRAVIDSALVYVQSDS